MAPAYQIQADWHMDTTIWRWQMYGGKVLKARLQLRTRPQKHCYHQISTRKKKKNAAKTPRPPPTQTTLPQKLPAPWKTRKHWQHHHHAPPSFFASTSPPWRWNSLRPIVHPIAWGCTLGRCECDFQRRFMMKKSRNINGSIYTYLR